MKTNAKAIEGAFAAVAEVAAKSLNPETPNAERAAKLRADLYFASAADLAWLAAHNARERARMAVRMVVRGKCYATGEDVDALTRLALRNPDAPEVAGLKLRDLVERYRIANRNMIAADR
jgi:hypothetical protein